jgi:exoribonuclease-2
MQHLPPVQPGCIVEFLQDNQPVIAWALEAAAGKVRVFTVGQREAKLPSSRLLPWTGPQYSPEASRLAVLETLRAHASRRQTLAQGIDALEIWELAQGELVQADILWLGSLLFTQPEPDHLAALGHKLLYTKTHFRFTPPHFEIFPLDVVQRRQEEMHRAEERRRLVGFGQEFLRALWDQAQGKPSKLPTPDPEQEAQLRQLLHARISTPEDRDSETLWKTMAAGLPEDPWMPLILAETWGIVPRHYNAYLARADYTWGPEWADPFASEIEAIIHNVQQIDIPPEPTPFLTVDAATTQDIDDGFWVAREKEGWRVLLALACPALGWSFGSALDEAVRHRFSSLYLPEGTSHMLPERLGTDAFSLRAGEPRPALVIECTVNPEGIPTTCAPRLRRACVAANTTYEAVEQHLDAQSSSMLAEALAAATALRQHRIAEGAVITEQSEPYIFLEGDGPLVRIRTMASTPRAQTIVSEFMILANSVLAAWGQEIGLPLLFRTQNITVPAECAGVWSEPHDIYRVVGRLGPSLLETTPRRHATVAANPYATITSPLRRYVDLVNMAQILAATQGQSPIFSQADLEALLPALCQRAELVGQVQRARTRYWKFEYLRQRAKNRQFPAIIVDATPVVATVAMPDLCLFLKAPRKVFGDKLRLGQRFHIRLGRVDPLAGEARVIEAWEV